MFNVLVEVPCKFGWQIVIADECRRMQGKQAASAERVDEDKLQQREEERAKEQW